jgi:hypothetical protein
MKRRRFGSATPDAERPAPSPGSEAVVAATALQTLVRDELQVSAGVQSELASLLHP